MKWHLALCIILTVGVLGFLWKFHFQNLQMEIKKYFSVSANSCEWKEYFNRSQDKSSQVAWEWRRSWGQTANASLPQQTAAIGSKCSESFQYLQAVEEGNICLCQKAKMKNIRSQAVFYWVIKRVVGCFNTRGLTVRVEKPSDQDFIAAVDFKGRPRAQTLQDIVLQCSSNILNSHFIALDQLVYMLRC